MHQIQILGIEGHHRTTLLTENVRKAITELKLSVPLRQIYDLNTLLRYKIHHTPAIMVNGRLMMQSEIPSVEDLKILFKTLSIR